jgi:hypothetical protein
VSKIDHGLRTEPSHDHSPPHRTRQQPGDASKAPAGSKGGIMTPANQMPEPEIEARREMAYFIETRRNMLRYARTFPPGAARNEHRQIALSLRGLFKNETWLKAHTLGGDARHDRLS